MSWFGDCFFQAKGCWVKGGKFFWRSGVTTDWLLPRKVWEGPNAASCQIQESTQDSRAVNSISSSNFRWFWTCKSWQTILLTNKEIILSTIKVYYSYIITSDLNNVSSPTSTLAPHQNTPVVVLQRVCRCAIYQDTVHQCTGCQLLKDTEAHWCSSDDQWVDKFGATLKTGWLRLDELLVYITGVVGCIFELWDCIAEIGERVGAYNTVWWWLIGRGNIYLVQSNYVGDRWLYNLFSGFSRDFRPTHISTPSLEPKDHNTPRATE